MSFIAADSSGAVGHGRAPAAKRIAIVQSNYIPWIGYFDLIRRVDEFVLFDDVQFTKRDWRNRNLIKTPDGLRWLTIPVVTKGRYTQRICDVEISDENWARRHWLAIAGAYGRAPGFADAVAALEPFFLGLQTEPRLSGVNRALLTALCPLLGLATPLRWSMDYGGHQVDGRGAKTERLVAICRAADATHYLSGPAARAYLDEASFAAAGITVEWMDYSHYRPYRQLHGPFERGVSVIDVLAHLGRDAAAYLHGLDMAA